MSQLLVKFSVQESPSVYSSVNFNQLLLSRLQFYSASGCPEIPKTSLLRESRARDLGQLSRSLRSLWHPGNSDIQDCSRYLYKNDDPLLTSSEPSGHPMTTAS